MCGIAGLIARDRLGPQQEAAVRRMVRVLEPRGPDGEGWYRDDHVAVGMRRLAVIDPSGGWQPLFNEDRSVVLVANGEIYNYLELRKSLRRSGHHFATDSDCETIVHLYEELGKDLVRELRGMFAFALWDARVRKLLLVRDRLGEKPLYVVVKADSLVFASELKALIGAGIVPLEFDDESVHDFFHFGYVPEPYSAIEGVEKLPAGHTLTVSLDTWQLEREEYWDPLGAEPCCDNPYERIRNELLTVAGLIVRSDVPVGVALSSGLDSGIVATLAAKTAGPQLKCFTIGYPGEPWQDERAGARALATWLGLQLIERTLEPGYVVANFERLVYSCDDPIADIAGSAYWAVAELARAEGVPVLLFGQGGDELFWGYSWVRQAVAAARRLGRASPRSLAGATAFIRPVRPPLSYTMGWDWLTSGAGLLAGARRWGLSMREGCAKVPFFDFSPSFMRARVEGPGIYGEKLRMRYKRAEPGARVWAVAPDARPDLMATRLIMDTYLRENGLAQADRLGMAHGIEVRLPLLDYKLVEAVIGLRKSQPDDREAPKAWLRGAVGGLVPDFVLAAKKRGFAPPWRDWYKALFSAYGQLLPGGILENGGYISRDAALRLSRGLKWPSVPTPLAFEALTLEVWARGLRGAIPAPLDAR
jgi:asparagine synthase (glutamine-hydrolysing)